MVYNWGVKKGKLRAFSVIELMITVIVVGLLMFAFIPTIAKKMANVGIDVGSQIATNDSCKKFGDGCVECNDVHCTSVAATYYLKEGRAFACNESGYEGMEGCATCEDDKKCLACIAGYKIIANKCEPCEAGTYSNLGDSSCTSCQINMYAADKAYQCTPCERGTYLCFTDGKTGDTCNNCSQVIEGCAECRCNNAGNVICSSCVNPCTISSGACNCPFAVLKKEDTWFTSGPLHKSKISSIEFRGEFNPNADEYNGKIQARWTVSERGSNAHAIAYAFKDEEKSNFYKIIIATGHDFIKIRANKESQNAFKDFVGVKLIKFGNNFDASQVENMQSMFENTATSTVFTEFKIEGISSWNTLKVKDMSKMFKNSGNAANVSTWTLGNDVDKDADGDMDGIAAIQYVGYKAWDVSNVTTMESMFENAGYFAKTWWIGKLGMWQPKKVENMSHMFDHAGYSAEGWAMGIFGNWKDYVTNVKDMSYMFAYVGYSEPDNWSIGDLQGWKVSNVTNMSHMFDHAGFNAKSWDIGAIGNWNVSNVTDMSHMFAYAGYNATSWYIGHIGNWQADVKNVKDMSHMFDHAGYSSSTFDLGDIGNWQVYKVTNMSHMFSHAGYNVTNYSNWKIASNNNSLGWLTSSLNNTSHMFENAGYRLDKFYLNFIHEVEPISRSIKWDTSSVTNMSYMFSRADAAGNCSTTDMQLAGLPDLRVQNVKDMSYMFQCVHSSTLAVTSTAYINAYTFNGWNVSSLEEANGMFKLFNQYGTGSFYLFLDEWKGKTNNLKKANEMFYGVGKEVSSYYSLSVKNWDVTNLEEADSMFRFVGFRAQSVFNFNIDGWNPVSLKDMDYMFESFAYTKTHMGVQALDILSTWSGVCETAKDNHYNYNLMSIVNPAPCASW